jgi:hypothetical protein
MKIDEPISDNGREEDFNAKILINKGFFDR